MNIYEKAKGYDYSHYRYPIDQTYPLFPEWTTINIPWSDQGRLFKYVCYIRWKDYDGTIRQELKSKSFKIDLSNDKEINDLIKETTLQEFIRDCYFSMFTNCEKYKYKKFIEGFDDCQTPEDEFILDSYKRQILLDDIANMDFKIGIEE